MMNYFDEQWYLQTYPDVRNAVAKGNLASAIDHFRTRGRAEGRLACDPKLLARFTEADKIVVSKACHFDRLWVTTEGIALILGWLDNRSDSIRSLSFAPHVGAAIPLDRHVLRYYRADVVEKRAADEKNYDYGVWILFDGLTHCRAHLGGHVRIEFASGCAGELEVSAHLISPEEMRGRILDTVSSPRRCHYSIAGLGETMGPILRRVNAEVLARCPMAPPVFHGRRLKAPDLSLVVTFQRVDSILRQAALFAGLPGIENVEFVWVNNQPAESSIFHTVAESAHVLYGLNIVSISVSEHIGFAAATNRASQIAGGSTLLFLASGVIPGARDCLASVLSAAATMGQNDVLGAQLLTENNAVRTIGRSFRLSDCVDGLWRHEDVSKGMPMGRIEDRTRVDIDAVAAAAMLVRRKSFIDLGGFDERYLSDDYPDNDYCLRAQGNGGQIAVDPSLLFYHLEGGPGPQRPSREWAAALMDRVFFNETWRATIEMHGQARAAESLGASACEAQRARN